MEAVAGQDTSIAAHCKTAVFQPGQGDLFWLHLSPFKFIYLFLSKRLLKEDKTRSLNFLSEVIISALAFSPSRYCSRFCWFVCKPKGNMILPMKPLSLGMVEMKLMIQTPGKDRLVILAKPADQF